MLLAIQIPLKLGWALTIHKSQGMTLTRAEVDVGGAFSFGQAYVALSRVTGSAGLWMRRDLRPQDVSVSREVLQYHGYQPQQQTVTVSRGGGGSAPAAASPQQQPQPQPSLTPEQLARIAANREAALARRRERIAQQQQQAAAAPAQ